MTDPTPTDDLLHRALADIGPALPEPRAPRELRERLAANARAAAPHNARTMRRRRPLIGALATAALAFAAVSALLFIQNGRLRSQLESADGGTGAVIPARADLPPLVAVRFYHPQCDVAKAVAPRFEEMQRSHPSDQVLFVSLDISEREEARSERLACALDCDFVFACDDAPVTSGMVVLADTRARQVIKASHDATDIDDLEQALDAALIACNAPPRE